MNDADENKNFIQRILGDAREENAKTTTEKERQRKNDETRRFEMERRKFGEQKLKDDEKRRVVDEIQKLDNMQRNVKVELRQHKVCECYTNRRSLE